MQTKSSLSKRIVIVVVVLCGIVIAYSLMHMALNMRAQNKYANENMGFAKNELEDYYKKVNGIVLNYYEADYTSFKTNLSAGDEKVALIIWISILSDEKEYGVIIQDSERKETRQIQVDKRLQAKTKEEQGIIDRYDRDLTKIKATIKEEWGIEI